MHEPPRSDAAGLQTPDRYRADEGPDGGWRLTNKRTALVSRAQLGEWCKAEDVDATLAALRARTEGLQHENRELRDAPELLRGSIACLEKQLAALRASHETLQAERDTALREYQALLVTINLGRRLSGESPSASVIRWQQERVATEAAIRALYDKWLDPEFWKDKGALMDSVDCADALLALADATPSRTSSGTPE